MRIATGGYTHETNCFGTILVTEEVVNNNKQYAERFLSVHNGIRTGSAGLIDEAKELGVDLVPALCVTLLPSGPTVQKVFEDVRDEIVDLLWQAHCEAPLDGIALQLHGAGVAQGYQDLEAELLRAVRARFGNEIPVAISLDLHGNISPEMIEMSDLAVGYKCYPHVDVYETGRKMLNLLHKRISGGKPLGKSLVRLPWHLSPGFGETIDGAAKDVQQFMLNLVEQEPELLDASFFHGFPYADIPQACVSVVTVAMTQEAADRFAKRIAQYAWDRRENFTAAINSAEQAVEQALSSPFPVVINEASDNPGGGCPGDGTWLLRELIRRDIPGTAFGFMFDPAVAEAAAKIGEGGRITCELGAKNDQAHGTPILLENVLIKKVVHGVFVAKNPMEAGVKRDLGTTVLLQCGNVQIVVGSCRTQTKDDGPFEVVGINWEEQRILALKSTNHFKGWWYGKAKTIIPCDSPGIHSADLNTFDFKYLNKSYYPFEDAQWSPENA